MMDWRSWAQTPRSRMESEVSTLARVMRSSRAAPRNIAPMVRVLDNRSVTGCSPKVPDQLAATRVRRVFCPVTRSPRETSNPKSPA